MFFRYLFVFLQLFECIFALGWTDICNFTTRTCYLWNGNDLPYANVQNVMDSPICQFGCNLLLNPFAGTCTNITTCSTIPQNGVPASPAFNFDPPILVDLDNIVIGSMDSLNPVEIQCNFNALVVKGQNVRLIGLKFTGPGEIDRVLSDQATIVWTGGGMASLINISSSSFYAVALFVNVANFLTLTLENVFLTSANQSLVQSKFPVSVVLLQIANISLQCISMPSNSVFLLGQSNLPLDSQNSCTQNLDLAKYALSIPILPPCNRPITIQLDQNCPNPSIFATLVALLSCMVAAFAIPLLFTFIERLQRHLHSNSIATTREVGM